MKMRELQEKYSYSMLGDIYSNSGGLYLLVIEYANQVLLLELSSGRTYKPQHFSDDYTCVGKLDFKSLKTALLETRHES